MRMRRAHEHQVRQGGALQVVGEAAFAAQQRRILDAVHVLAAAEAAGLDRAVRCRRHGCPSPSC